MAEDNSPPGGEGTRADVATKGDYSQLAMGDGVERPKLPLFKRFESSGYCFTISHAFQAQLKKVDEKVPKTCFHRHCIAGRNT